MIKVVMMATVMAGIAASMVGPSLATVPTLPETDVFTAFRDTGNMARLCELANKSPIETHRLFVRRKSSSPPGESHSGRISSSPAGQAPESGRDSGRTLDPSERTPENEATESTSNQSPKESMVTPKKGGDPLEGGRKSQPPFKRRGGVVE